MPDVVSAGKREWGVAEGLPLERRWSGRTSARSHTERVRKHAAGRLWEEVPQAGQSVRGGLGADRTEQELCGRQLQETRARIMVA